MKAKRPKGRQGSGKQKKKKVKEKSRKPLSSHFSTRVTFRCFSFESLFPLFLFVYFFDTFYSRVFICFIASCRKCLHLISIWTIFFWNYLTYFEMSVEDSGVKAVAVVGGPVGVQGLIHFNKNVGF